MRIEPNKPLLDLRTPLRLIPRFWLDYVEPRIRRPEGMSCWLWDGAVDYEGEPVVTARNVEKGSRGTRRVKRIIANHFWPMREDYHVLHACKNINCLNPQHFYVTTDHWKNTNIRQEINKIAARIKRWGERHA